MTATDASTRYDFIIIGGGSAGCALANRLSADPANRVLVLEAGRPDYKWDVFIHMPAALTFPIGSRFYDWKYESEPEPFMNGRRVYHARGKVLGGSSSINGMIFQRGNPLDYARWAADPGMADWDYAHCLPYFKRMETCLAGADEFRGGDGPLVLERGPADSPLFRAFFQAAQQAGDQLTSDVNGYRQEGFAPFDRNVHRGRRLSAARAYLHPVLSRPNLTLHTRAFVTRIRLAGSTATGVEYTRGGRPATATAGEIILCGGAINSPQLLQLSGIGSPEVLEPAGVTVAHELPGVGENLQDHLEVYVQYGCKQPVSVQPALKWRNRPLIGARWLFGRSGPGATNHFEGGGFACSNDDVAYPNLMFHFLPIAVRYDGSAPGRRARLSGAHRPDELRCARQRPDHLRRPGRQARAPVQLPVDRAGPAGVGRGDQGRPHDPDPAGDGSVQRRRAVAGAGRADARAGPGLGQARRRDSAAPVLHVRDGHRPDGRDRPG